MPHFLTNEEKLESEINILKEKSNIKDEQLEKIIESLDANGMKTLAETQNTIMKNFGNMAMNPDMESDINGNWQKWFVMKEQLDRIDKLMRFLDGDRRD